MASKEGDYDQADPDPARVREQLAIILASPEFLASERGRRFLRYIVEEALEGRREQLKAYTIAQAVFGRDASFDAQNDPVVRIDAGRIRRALERYYLVSGNNDLVRITIPKGGYAPQFVIVADRNPATERKREEKPSPAVRGAPTSYRDLILPIGVPAIFGAIAMLALIRPLESYLWPPQTSPAAATSALNSKAVIAVEPFAALGGTNESTDFANGLADQMIAKLMNVDGVVVLAPGRSGGEAAGALLNLQGSVLVEDGTLHVHARLINGSDGAVAWATRYDRDLKGQTIIDVEDEIAGQIAKEVSKSLEIARPAATP
ncbi:hypothetical protein ASE04_15635 [Rhizobium sp. Root708]|uniref:hypothetical protein n=1 Tax=Rhizobium sp. Root708 TaxID=1736592 RepID=UPI0006FA7234|nr:hypothetical protein [Rhizobium sp. Root708]KRB50014.1 hypothetical protein ASE04_15635 [Rhizobium sp. Root708]